MLQNALRGRAGKYNVFNTSDFRGFCGAHRHYEAYGARSVKHVMWAQVIGSHLFSSRLSISVADTGVKPITLIRSIPP